MQFIDPRYNVGGLGGGRVVVKTPDNIVRGEDGATIPLDAMGRCPDSAFDGFKVPYTLVIKDATGKTVFEIAMEGK
jgi:hypothetical protein